MHEMHKLPFVEFPKIARFNREVIVTEKIDGTNAQILVNDTGDDLIAGSRTKWVTPGDDNAGFASWVKENKTELLKLGPGSHFGEWWGSVSGSRGYGLKEKRFSLFNSTRWATDRPACCAVVPVLFTGLMEDMNVTAILEKLKTEGSVAAPGFMNPEGIIIFHVGSSTMFKKTLDKHDQSKGVK